MSTTKPEEKPEEKVEPQQEEDSDEEDKKETKKLSKSQQKRAKAKKKKEKGETKKEKPSEAPTSALAKLAAARAAKHKEEEEKRKAEEEIRRKEAEEEAKREAERKRKAEEERLRKIEELKQKYQEEKKAGMHLSEAQKKEREKAELARQEMLKQIEEQNKNLPKKPKKKGKQVKEQKDEKSEITKESEEKKALNEENKQNEEKKEEVPDMDWTDLAQNLDKIDTIVRHKLSMDETEITADKMPEAEKKQEAQPKPETKAEEIKTEEKPVETRKPAENEPKKEPKPKKQHAEKSLEEEKGAPELRAPILCVLGHVDTGKTKLLDKIRRTKVQEGEVGGITQQIGATFFPKEVLEDHAKTVKGIIDISLNIPGLLVIDTPGHESFSNLRNRGSTLCDFAILLVDIMHGLENQTIESINILKKRKIPFVVALNKIDRCYNWKSKEYDSSKRSFERNPECHQQFMSLANKVIAQFAEQEINARLYWENTDPDTFVSLVPTSAITGEGVPDILTYVVKRIQETLSGKILYKPKLVSTVMEVKVVEGYGVTCDVILVTGELSVDDTIILSGFDGPIVTNIRALLTPQPLKEMRVKGEYIHHKTVRGTMGVKLCAPGLEDALAGSPVYVAHNPEEVEEKKKEAGEELSLMIKKYLSKTGEGVYVQSSTLGSLEALLELLKGQKVPVSNIGLGPIFKRHILKVLKASEKKGEREEYATILAFEVEPDKEAKELAEKNGIKIFTAKIVYHLADSYKKHAEECLYFILRD